jgi:hypothetical protein
MLQQITGRPSRIVAMPAGLTLAAGRVADLMDTVRWRTDQGHLPAARAAT